MTTLLRTINEHLKSAPERLGECAVISTLRGGHGQTFYVATLYLWAGASKDLTSASVARWFEDAGCVHPVVYSMLHDRDFPLIDGQVQAGAETGLRAWEVSFSVPDPVRRRALGLETWEEDVAAELGSDLSVPPNVIEAIQAYGDARADNKDSGAAIGHAITCIRTLLRAVKGLPSPQRLEIGIEIVRQSTGTDDFGNLLSPLFWCPGCCSWQDVRVEGDTVCDWCALEVVMKHNEGCEIVA